MLKSTAKKSDAPPGGVGRCAVGVVAFGCVRKGHMEYAEGWERHGQVRVVSTRKNTEQNEAPRDQRETFLPTFFVSKKSRTP